MKYKILLSLTAIFINLIYIQAIENDYVNSTSQFAIMNDKDYNALISFYQNSPNNMLFIKGVLKLNLSKYNYEERKEEKQYAIRIYDKIANNLCEKNVCNFMGNLFNSKTSNKRSTGNFGNITLNIKSEFYLYDGYSSLNGTSDNIIGKICALYQINSNEENIIGCGIINSGITVDLSKVNNSFSKLLIFYPIFIFIILLFYYFSLNNYI